MSKTYLVIAPLYLPNLGGVEQYTYNLTKEMIKNGNKVIILTSEIIGQSKHEIIENVEVFRLDSWHFMKGRFPVMKWTRSTRKVFDKIKEMDIDYVVINTKFYYLSYYGAKYAKTNNIPAILIEHGTGHIEFQNKVVKKVGEMYEHAIARAVYHQCKNFVGVSEECNKWLKHFGINAIGILYNAVDYDMIQKQIECKDYETRIEELCAGWKTVIFAGRLLKEKGIKKLVDAQMLLNREIDNIRLIVAGDGPMLDVLQDITDNEKVVWLGKVDSTFLMCLFSKVDVFCLPTDYPEGLSTAVLEAMAAGCYVITTSKGGAKEVINKPKYGRILEINTTEAIKEAIKYAILEDDYRIEVSQNAKIRIKDGFTWNKTFNCLLKVLEGLRIED